MGEGTWGMPYEEIVLDSCIENVNTVTEWMDVRLENLGASFKANTQLDIAMDELFSNIVNHAYGAEGGKITVAMETVEETHSVIVSFMDGGKPFNPMTHKDPDITLSAAERSIGGLGIFMVKKTMDDMTYEYKDGRNILKIRKVI